ncbi:anthranilate synthase component II [Pseudemcibacter aquimaris]|uniref:anthranilate synthase component II n=1 Tax=Pseudemcibacter aquimaris TaxID=2857064 RepID=UPI002011DA71|nr:aminodeoxychorismate/anthranilate synthase component II [Pseudemcibacter aquimaris]MCC3861023.1 aminodeoxychorismate/anthranilate synthase component II [Pseudemcibacter aquimaris]WDU59841.1 aminodeoxychorismate/anthranilate synthase component II [Pseudemcibacter aquimaris]
MYILIDNYDSFTYNLYHYLGEIGVDVDVYRNDEITTDEIRAKNPEGIILSPGPCTPDEAGICMEIIEKLGADIPILGVCLGHQSIGQVYGGKVIRAPYLMHGKISPISHENKTIFNGFKNPFNATRYHSLIVERESVPDCLEITSETADGLIMGLSHKEHPVHGVQFHPESIASEHGHDLLKNFIDLANNHNGGRRNVA